MGAISLSVLEKGLTTVELTCRRHNRKANNKNTKFVSRLLKQVVFGYLSSILAPFRMVFGYCMLKKSGNSAPASEMVGVTFLTPAPAPVPKKLLQLLLRISLKICTLNSVLIPKT